MSCAIVSIAYASNKLCLPTQHMSSKLGMERYAFTATMIAGNEDKGFVFQLYTKKGGFVMTFARNYGRTSCMVMKGDEWIWADHPVASI